MVKSSSNWSMNRKISAEAGFLASRRRDGIASALVAGSAASDLASSSARNSGPRDAAARKANETNGFLDSPGLNRTNIQSLLPGTAPTVNRGINPAATIEDLPTPD